MKVCICNNFNEDRLNSVYHDASVAADIRAARSFDDKCDILYKAASDGQDPACRTCFDAIELRIEEFIERHEPTTSAPVLGLSRPAAA